MASKGNGTYRNELFSSPQVSNNNSINSINIIDYQGTPFQDNVNLGQNSFVPQFNDAFTQSLSSISAVHLVVSVKLDDDNYVIWLEQMISWWLKRFQGWLCINLLNFLLMVVSIQVLLTGIDLTRCLKGGLALWLKIKVHVWIHLEEITAYEQWIALEEAFSSSSQEIIMDLWLQLQNLSKDGLSASEYILKAKTIADHLAAFDEPVFNRDFMIFIVRGIGTNLNYTSLVTYVNMNKNKPLVSALWGIIEAYDRMLTKQRKLELSQVFQAHIMVNLSRIFKAILLATCNSSFNNSHKAQTNKETKMVVIPTNHLRIHLKNSFK